ncbi:MAG: hypothetical protein LH609_08875 [Rudanella sp.]|nr:hypothetical protein [Rudanella sp.]
MRPITVEVDNLNAVIAHLTIHGVEAEPIPVDETTHKRFTFIADPNGLPIEVYER